MAAGSHINGDSFDISRENTDVILAGRGCLLVKTLPEIPITNSSNDLWTIFFQTSCSDKLLLQKRWCRF